MKEAFSFVQSRVQYVTRVSRAGKHVNISRYFCVNSIMLERFRFDLYQYSALPFPDF